MSNIFLTSSLQSVAKDLAKHLDSKIKKFLFINTASEIEKGDKTWLIKDRDSMTDLRYQLEDYTLADKTKNQVANALAKVDGVIMAGGNTFYLLWKIQQSDSAEPIKKFVEDGGVYIGSSAGSMVAGPDLYATREKKELDPVPEIKDFKGLGITDIMIQPHWGSEHFKESYLNEIMRHSYIPGFKQILLSDNQYVTDWGDEKYELIEVE
jgi:dipeptidase E